MAAIAAKHQVHPNHSTTWTRQALHGLARCFASGGSLSLSELVATIRAPYGKESSGESSRASGRILGQADDPGVSA